MCYGAKYFSSLPVACKSITSKRSNWYDQRKLQHGEDEDADEDEKRRDRKVAMVTDDTITPVITHNNKQKKKTSQYSSCLIIHSRRDEFSCWWRSFNCVTQAATVGVARNNKRERSKKKVLSTHFLSKCSNCDRNSSHNDSVSVSSERVTKCKSRTDGLVRVTERKRERERQRGREKRGRRREREGKVFFSVGNKEAIPVD